LISSACCTFLSEDWANMQERAGEEGHADITAAALIAGAAQAIGRDPGPPDKRVVAAGQFDRIAVAGPFRVVVRTDKDTAVTLSGPRTMLDDTEMVVRDGQLIIRWQEGASWSRNGDHGVDIEIGLPVLREAMTAGSGSIEVDRVRADSFAAMLLSSGSITVDAMDVKQFRAQLAGSGSLAIRNLDAQEVDVDLAGSGEMRAKGRTGTADLRLSASGSFNNPAFIADDAAITLGGSGHVRSTVKNSADIKSVGSGSVTLTGGAKCTVSKHGTGEVRCS
jgi:Putative auto-transporter adhesin, head GIN domain